MKSADPNPKTNKLVNDDNNIKAFILGAIPGWFSGLYFLFDNTPVGEFAIITSLMKLFMAFSLAAATGMGTLVGKYVYKKITEKINKRKQLKDGKRNNDSRAA